MKARLVKYADDGWQWEIFSGNGCIVCSAILMFPSKKAALRALVNFTNKFSYVAVQIIWYKDKLPVLDCSK